MKYLSFEEWFDKQKFYLISRTVKKLMLDAWDAATKNYPVDEVKNRINELQAIIEGAMQIECSCNKISIKMGFPCICVKAGAVTQSMVNLSEYLGEIREIENGTK